MEESDSREEIKLISQKPATEYNLAPFVVINETTNSFDLKHQIDYLRIGYENAKNKERYFSKLIEKIGDEKENSRVKTFKYDFGGLPQKIGFISKPGSVHKTYLSNVPLVLPKNDFEKNGWRLITEVDKNAERPVLINWMEARERKSLVYMRFWFSPNLYREETMIPSKWTGRFEYRSRTGEFNDKLHLDEKVKIEIPMHFYQGEFKYGFNGWKNVIFSQWPVCHEEDKKITFKFKDGTPEEILFNNPENPISIKEIDKMITMNNKYPGLSFEESLLARTFPNFKANAKRLDLDKTIENLLGVFRNGTLEDLSGFKQIEFSTY